MFFKIHLLVISSIILIMFIIWNQLESAAEFETAHPIALRDTPYKIDISKASWGLNCLDLEKNNSNRSRRQSFSKPKQQQDPFWSAEKSDIGSLVYENNVVAAAKQQCDGLARCVLDPKSKALGADPAPNCYKELTVEYRCFDVDRPWYITTFGEQLAIDCDKQNRK